MNLVSRPAAPGVQGLAPNHATPIYVSTHGMSEITVVETVRTLPAQCDDAHGGDFTINRKFEAR